MKTYSFYRRETGILTGEKLLTDNLVDRQLPDGCGAVEGDFDHLRARVDVSDPGRLVVVDSHASRPDSGFQWHADVNKWRVSEAVQATIEVRAAALRRITQIEEAQPRTIREFALGFAGAAERLKAMDDEICALRSDL